MSNELENTGRILIYQNEKGDTKINVYFEDDTIWMTQKNIAELYQTTPQNITLHIKNIYTDGELEELATCKNYLQVQNEGYRQVKRAIAEKLALDQYEKYDAARRIEESADIDELTNSVKRLDGKKS